MARLLLVIIGLAAGVAGGVTAGFWLWGRDAAKVPGLDQRLQALQSDTQALERQRGELAERIEQISKEQERLARENEMLREQRVKDQLTGDTVGDAPLVLPPK